MWHEPHGSSTRVRSRITADQNALVVADPVGDADQVRRGEWNADVLGLHPVVPAGRLRAWLELMIGPR